MAERKILYILSGNLSTTPRALHSVLTAKEFFDVEILYVNRSPVWLEFDKKIIEKYNLNCRHLELSRKSYLTWIKLSFIYVISKILYPRFKHKLFISAFASNKAHYLLYEKLTQNKNKYDLVLAHGAGAIFPAFIFAFKQKFKFVVDIEDFHPGEESGKNWEQEKERRTWLLQKILPRTAWFTYASPIIGEELIKLFPKKFSHPHFLINNCFPSVEFTKPNLERDKNEKIHFVWFSQNINFNRGLELIIPAFVEYSNQIELHLIGKIDPVFYEQVIKPYRIMISVHEPVTQTELHSILGKFDIGLALELTKISLNREICYSNKIFAYAQAGLFAMATNTQGQSHFYRQHPNLGIICNQSTQSLKKGIENIIKNFNKIHSDKLKRYNYSQDLSWDFEQEKLVKAWNKFFNENFEIKRND